MATMKPGGVRWGGARFSARPLKIRALPAQNHHNHLIEKHFLRPAFYSAVSQNPLALVSYPPRRPSARAEVACVGNSNTFHTFCIRLIASVLLHSRKPITQLLRFIRPA